MTNENIIKQLNRLIPSLKYADDVNAVKGAIQALKKENIYDDKEHYVTISKALYDKLNIDYEALSQKPICPSAGVDCEDCPAYEPCEDAISRQAYIERFRKWAYSEYGRKIDNEALAIRVAMSLPSVTPQQKYGEWIPVSERLPEVFSFVNCTCHSLIDDREDWVVETCYLPQLPDSPYSDWGNIPMLNYGDCEVVAWMYRDIPKPYKVEPQERSEKE